MTNQTLLHKAADAYAVFVFSALLCVVPHLAWADVNVTIRGTVVAPQVCVINGGSTLTVPFGDNLLTTRIDGIEYRRSVPYTVTCTGSPANAMTLTLTGSGASFDAQALATNNPDLGIKLYINGASWPLNTIIKFTYPTLPVMEAVPVKKAGSTLKGGAFSAVATLVVAQQ
ncbi:fimbrial protein [Pseudomonas lundensis]|uniref:fimbrial protein n=1 Tax=Pseudomonas lundensis TaxID=86185 RepID=UPI000BA20C0F|nr:fimbrial protein [Pseudomonas lundensis]OZY51348.1 exotoxin [Pseudomonas lundensis]